MQLVSLIVLFINIHSFTIQKIILEVEVNPGSTYSIEKSLLGTFHQGDSRFGDAAGITEYQLRLRTASHPDEKFLTMLVILYLQVDGQ